MHIPLFYLDAFADRPGAGNPAAVSLLDSWLDDEAMRKVAAENNLSATAFLLPRNKDYELRWFTYRCELKFCGHATLASGYAVLRFLRPELSSVQFVTRFRGTLTVRKDEDLLAMDFPALFPKPAASVPDTLLQALGTLSPPSQVLEVNETYFAAFDTPDEIRNLRPNISLLERLHPFAVSVSAPGDRSDIISRYFAPGYGIPEDPVTGSAHCALTPYWTKRLGKNVLHARQVSQRGGELWCEMAGERVMLKGKAVLTMKGSLELSS